MTDTPQVLLEHHLKKLKLPTFLREYGKLARQCAADGVDHVRYLHRLAELELIDRERRMVERRIKAARFPVVKSLDSFNFKAIPSLNKTLVLELARCEYVERRDNVIALGNSGTGKTHIALGLGLAACQKGLGVGFTTAAARLSRSTPRIVAPTGWHRNGQVRTLGDVVSTAGRSWFLHVVRQARCWPSTRPTRALEGVAGTSSWTKWPPWIRMPPRTSWAAVSSCSTCRAISLADTVLDGRGSAVRINS